MMRVKLLLTCCRYTCNFSMNIDGIHPMPSLNATVHFFDSMFLVLNILKVCNVTLNFCTFYACILCLQLKFESSPSSSFLFFLPLFVLFVYESSHDNHKYMKCMKGKEKMPQISFSFQFD